MIVQVNVAAPVAEVASVTVTVTEPCAHGGGRPGNRSGARVDAQAGGQAGRRVVQGLVGLVVRRADRNGAIVVLSVLLWAPGLMTLTVLPPGLLTVQANDAVPDAPVASVAVIVTLAL